MRPNAMWSLTLMLLLAVITGSVAAAAVDVTPSDPTDSAIGLYAAEFGVSREEAQRRLKLQTDLDRPIAEIVAIEGGRVAGFGIQHSPTFGGFVFLAGEEAPTPEASAVSDDFGVLIEIRTGFRHSLGELQQGLAELPEGVRMAAISTDIDINSNAIIIGVTDEDIRTALASTVAALPVRATIELQAPDGLDGTVNGGRPMSPVCTSGFGVKNAAGTRGISTAAHCSNSLSVDGIALTYVAGAWNSVMDVQWHTASGHVVTDDFYQGSGYIDVGSVVSRSNSSGDYVCHYGKGSGNSCGYVTSIFYSPNSCGGVECDNVFIKVEGSYLRACDGDSGGPWYNGNQAYGIHKGSVGENCTGSISSAHFTSSTYFSNIGISILTS